MFQNFSSSLHLKQLVRTSMKPMTEVNPFSKSDLTIQKQVVAHQYLERFFDRVKANYEKCIKDRTFVDTLPDDSVFTYLVMEDAHKTIQGFHKFIEATQAKGMSFLLQFYSLERIHFDVGDFKDLSTSKLGKDMDIKEEYKEAFFEYLPYSHCNLALMLFFTHLSSLIGTQESHLFSHLSHTQNLLQLGYDYSEDVLVRMFGLTIDDSYNIKVGDLSYRKSVFRDRERGLHARRNESRTLVSLPLVYNEATKAIELEINEKALILSMLEVAPAHNNDYQKVFNLSSDLLGHLFRESIIEYPNASSYFK